MVLQSIKSVFTLMILILTGYYFTGKKWFGKPGMDFLSKFTVQVSVPCYMFYNMYEDIDGRGALLDLAVKLPVTFGSILLNLAVTAVACRLLKVGEGRRNTFVAAAGFANVVFIGFPVIQSLWGGGITSTGVIYYISSTLLFWTVGTALLRRDSRLPGKGEANFLGNLKKILSPPIIGLIAGVAVVLLEVELPDFILSPVSMLKSVTSPLAMVFIGSVIRNMDLRKMEFGRDLYAALGMRFLVLPVVTALFLRAMPVPSEMKQVFFVLSTMPSMTQMGIMAKEYESDYEFACTVITATTIVSMLTIPVFMYLMQTFRIF